MLWTLRPSVSVLGPGYYMRRRLPEDNLRRQLERHCLAHGIYSLFDAHYAFRH